MECSLGVDTNNSRSHFSDPRYRRSTFHSVNGIRLIFTHGGMGLGKPGRPDYPYDALSLNYRQKSGIWIGLILVALAMLYGADVLFGTK